MSTVVVGVGNAWRQDDSVGLVVAGHLRARCPGHRVHECSGDCTALLQLCDGASRLIIVDAIASGAKAGTLSHLRLAELAGARGVRASTHAIGVTEAIALGHALGALPPSVELYGIEVRDTGFGSALSPPVQRTADALVRELVDRLAEVEPSPPPGT